MFKKLLFMLGGIIAFSSFVSFGYPTQESKDSGILKINDHSITQEEFIYSNKNVDQVLLNKMTQILALDKGLTNDISYEALEEQRQKANEERQKAFEKGLPLYGPKELSPQLYYNNHISELTIALRKEIAIYITPDDPGLLDFYNYSKESRYKNTDSVVADLSFVSEGRLLNTSEISLDALNIRALSESDQALFNVLSTIQPGESIYFTNDNGLECHLYGKSRTPGAYFALNDHFAAISNDYATFLLDYLLQEALANATITELTN